MKSMKRDAEHKEFALWVSEQAENIRNLLFVEY